MTAICEITNERVKMPCSKSDCLRFGKCVVSYVMGKPKTNADHIRSMTDEELAETIVREFCAVSDNTVEFIVAKTRFRLWLKQPYKEES